MKTTSDFDRGYWEALGDVLNHLNTYETVMVDKTEVYKRVFEMRPYGRLTKKRET